MGERRKQKSGWDEDDTKLLSGISENNSLVANDRRSAHDSGHYHEVSESRTRKPRDDHGWPPWEPIEDQPIAPSISFKNTKDVNEFDGGKIYHKNMSPGYDGMELRNYNNTHGYDQSHFHRNSGRGRSRSPSRSLSRGRERERESKRERRRGWNRSRSRSSSRNRYDAKPRDHTRSRSPINERLSYAWSERRNVPEKSSQICRDLSSGSCRRGSQCRYLHPNTTNRRERDRMVENQTESWRGRTDHNRVPRPSYSRPSGFESRNDFPDPYHEDRRVVHCKDFSKANDRFGDASRYSHPEDDFGQGTGYTSSDKSQSGKPLCKFFAAGKCNRVNCWFSHEGNSDRRREATDRHSRDKSNWSDAPRRDNATKILDKSDRRGEVNNSRSHNKGNLWGPMSDDANNILDTKGRGVEVANMRSRDMGNWSDDAAKISDTNDNRRRDIVTESCTRDKDTWHGPSWNDATNISDTNDRQGEVTDSRSHEYGIWSNDPIWDNATKISDSGNGQTDRRSGNKNKTWGIIESALPGSFAEPITKENTSHEKGQFMSYGSQFQDHDGMAMIDGQNALQENIYPPQTQEQHSIVVKNNQMSLLSSDVLDEVKETITTNPIPYPGHQNDGNIFPGHSSISSITDRGPNMMLPNPPNGYCADLNQPNTEIADPLNVTTHTLNEHKTSQSPRFLEANPQLLANLLAKRLSDQATNSRSFVDTEHPQTYTETPSFPDNSVWAPPVNTLTVQPHLGAITPDLNSTENGRENAEYDNHNISHGTAENQLVSQGTEEKQLSPLLGVGPPGFDSLKVRPEDVAANSEVNGGNKFVAVENKGLEESKHPETQNGHKKVEEELGANKDDKGTRLFKNSLVEFVKEILKPSWKEGRMSRDDYKTVVRKVVDKVSSTIHVDQIPKTQEKIDQYLACSKPKITKLVQAYVDRSLKKSS